MYSARISLYYESTYIKPVNNIRDQLVLMKEFRQTPIKHKKYTIPNSDKLVDFAQFPMILQHVLMSIFYAFRYYKSLYLLYLHANYCCIPLM